MNERFPAGQTAIVAASTFGRGEAPGYPAWSWRTRPRAGAGAGRLEPKDVDGRSPASWTMPCPD
jgi:hypothetical protein